MSDNEEIPEGIGPHEGRELELMLSGEKPAAMFSDVVPSSYDLPQALFAPYAESGQLVYRHVHISTSNPGDHDMQYLLYALPDEEWRLDRLTEIHRRFHEHNEPTSVAIETEIGDLLGYPASDIDVYVDRFFRDRR